MRLNTLERLWIHHPLRSWSQRTLEARPWKDLGADLRQGQVLEVGSGRGDGLAILQQDFAAAVVHGVELDPRQLRRAGRRHGHTRGMLQADATALPIADQSYDAVVFFNALHHVPDWRRALTECRRVLRPGGQLLLLETLRPFLEFPLCRLLMKHPVDRFDAAELERACLSEGFATVGRRTILGSFLWLVAEVPVTAPQCLKRAS